MVHSCCVINCTARWSGDKGFFRLPSENDKERRKKWLRNIRRADPEDPRKPWIPCNTDRVCKNHFVTGAPSKDQRHPDYTPNLNMGYTSTEKLEDKLKKIKRLERFQNRQSLNTASNSVPSSTAEPMDVENPFEEASCQQVSLNQFPFASFTVNKNFSCITCEHVQEEACASPLDSGDGRDELLKRQAIYFNQKCVQLIKEKKEIEEELQKASFTVMNLSKKQLKFYTGVRSWSIFHWIVRIVQNKDLAYRFGVTEDQVNKIIKKGVKVMAKALRFLIVWPDKEATIRNMPKVFKRSISYQKTRVIIDCSEIFIKRPTNLLARNITYSNYKHHNTMKFLVGITPCGAVSFLSKCWGGRVSDKELTLNSGFLDHLEYGDQVMADRGFLIKEELICRGASLVIPAFTKGKNQLKGTEVISSRKIANLRIHVERAIGRMKFYKILNSTWDLKLVESANDILLVVAALVNLQPPLVK
ncbi:unnamed protein product [Porites lobata]|uniref:THAP-type domain-containing protein n=1 Tax=Porites lobata TaxID=104759 RepID=A0ABN8PM20_9CNID|nr:unnamed protein product [Porites lobata]